MKDSQEYAMEMVHAGKCDVTELNNDEFKHFAAIMFNEASDQEKSEAIYEVNEFTDVVNLLGQFMATDKSSTKDKLIDSLVNGVKCMFEESIDKLLQEMEVELLEEKGLNFQEFPRLDLIKEGIFNDSWRPFFNSCLNESSCAGIEFTKDV